MIRKHKNLVKFWELEVAKPTQPYPETIVGTNEGGDWERIMSSNEKWAQSADEMGKSSIHCCIAMCVSLLSCSSDRFSLDAVRTCTALVLVGVAV